MLVITEIHPGDKKYKIEKIGGVYFCHPETEAEYLELLLVYNGNNIQGDLSLSFTKIKVLPDNLTVNGYLDLVNSKIPKDYPIPSGVKGRIFR